MKPRGPFTGSARFDFVTGFWFVSPPMLGFVLAWALRRWTFRNR